MSWRRRRTGRSAVLEVYRRVLVPLHLEHTRFLRGYDLIKEDVTVWSPSYDWTTGAIVSTDPDDPVAGYGLGVERRGMRCPDGTVTTLWGHSGAGPGYHSLALSTEDNERQLVLATNTFDITASLNHRPPMPLVDPRPLLNHAFC